MDPGELFHKKLFERAFGSLQNNQELILTDAERRLARYVYKRSRDEIRDGWHEIDDSDDDDDSADGPEIVFGENEETVLKIFERVVQLFKKWKKAKDSFLTNFCHFSSLQKGSLERLEAIADDLETHQCNCDTARKVGGGLSTVGGIAKAFFSWLAPAGTVASVIGSGVGLGATCTEIALTKKKLEEAKTVVAQSLENDSFRKLLFDQMQEMKEALESLVDYNLVKEMLEYLQDFFDEVNNETILTIADLKNTFKDKALRFFIRLLWYLNKKKDKFGDEVAPVIITFIIVFCLMREDVDIILDCAVVEKYNALIMKPCVKTIGKNKIEAPFGNTFQMETPFAPHINGILPMIGPISPGNLITPLFCKKDYARELKAGVRGCEELFSITEDLYNEMKARKTINLPIHHFPIDAEHVKLKLASILF